MIRGSRGFVSTEGKSLAPHQNMSAFGDEKPSIEIVRRELMNSPDCKDSVSEMVGVMSKYRDYLTQKSTSDRASLERLEKIKQREEQMLIQLKQGSNPLDKSRSRSP